MAELETVITLKCEDKVVKALFNRIADLERRVSDLEPVKPKALIGFGVADLDDHFEEENQ